MGGASPSILRRADLAVRRRCRSAQYAEQAMEINPFESRLRMLQQMDGVQMQREAAPDEETAGCPGCPYFWTCPVPHRGEEVRAPAEIDLEDVREVLGPRREYSPRDESDIGWTDVWVDEDGLRLEPEDAHEPASTQDAEPEDHSGPEDEHGPDQERRRADASARRGWRGLFRRRG